MLNLTSRKTTKPTGSAIVLKSNEGSVLQVPGSKLTSKLSSGEGWQFFEVVGSAGNQTPLHTHPWHEGFYVLEGEIDVQIEDEIVAASSGYFIHIPAGTAHGAKVRSPQVKLLNWVSDTRAQQFAQELATVAQPTPETVMAIRQKHQILPAEILDTGAIVHGSHPDRPSWLHRVWQSLVYLFV